MSTTNASPVALPYEKDEPNAYKWTTEAYDRLVSGKMKAELRSAEGVQSAVVSGDCPRCPHDVNFLQLLDAVAGERMAALGAEQTPTLVEYVPITVACQCTEPHKGRPESTKFGCGINFSVEIAAG